MLRRAVALVALLSTTACTAAATHHRTLGLAADVTAVTGAVVLGSQQTCGDPFESVDGFNDSVNCGTDNIGKTLLGSALVVLAAAMGVTALTLPGPDAAEATPAPAPIPTVVAQAPQPTQITDDLTVRLGFQAWRTAADGRCEASRVTMKAVLDRDIDYYAQLSLNPAIASCLR